MLENSSRSTNWQVKKTERNIRNKEDKNKIAFTMQYDKAG